MSDHKRLRVALLGAGEGAERWASALSDLPELRLLPELSDEADALVLAPGASDPFARAQQALAANIPVLYGAPFLLSPWRAAVLHDLSLRQRCLLRFPELFQYRPGFAFLRRAMAGSEPFWRPLYLRTLRLAEARPFTRIDELAVEELAMCAALLGGTPPRVTASAAWCEEGSDLCAVFLTLHYAGGPLVQCTISLAEATSARQLVAVTAGRTVMLDELGPVASVRIVGGGEPAPFSEGPAPVPRGTKLLAPASTDAVAAEVTRFVAAVREGDRSLANSGRWARVAALWRAARRSMNVGTHDGPGETEPPLLRVIEGGGRTGETAGERPPLTLIAG